MRVSTWLLIGALATIAGACSSSGSNAKGSGGSGGTAGSSSGGTAGSSSGCTPGDTRTCVGPGACSGGQSCAADGTWSTCDCGGGGSGGTAGASGAGGTGTGGAAGSGGSAGSDGGPGGQGGAGGSCGLSSSKPACADCINKSCCSQASACASDVDCTGVAACVDQNCQSQFDLNCAGMYCNSSTSGFTLYSNFISCVATNCSTECS